MRCITEVSSDISCVSGCPMSVPIILMVFVPFFHISVSQKFCPNQSSSIWSKTGLELLDWLFLDHRVRCFVSLLISWSGLSSNSCQRARGIQAHSRYFISSMLHYSAASQSSSIIIFAIGSEEKKRLRPWRLQVLVGSWLNHMILNNLVVSPVEFFYARDLDI